MRTKEELIITKCENRDRDFSALKEEADKLTDYAIDLKSDYLFQ